MPLFLRSGAAVLRVVLVLASAVVAVRAADDKPAAPSQAVENTVVKIFSTVRYPDPFKPWTKQAPRESPAPA